MVGPSHERYGSGECSWLSGTASWMFLAASQYILGFRPDYDGVIIDPCVPAHWDGFSYTRVYREISCTVLSTALPFENARSKKLIVDGEELDGNFLPYDKIKGKKSVEIKVVY